MRAGGQHIKRLHLDLLATMTAGSAPALYHPDNLGGEIGDGQEKRDSQPSKPLRRKLRCRFHEEQREDYQREAEPTLPNTITFPHRSVEVGSDAEWPQAQRETERAQRWHGGRKQVK